MAELNADYGLFWRNTVEYTRQKAHARLVKMPFYNPGRKRA